MDDDRYITYVYTQLSGRSRKFCGEARGPPNAVTLNYIKHERNESLYNLIMHKMGLEASFTIWRPQKFSCLANLKKVIKPDTNLHL